MSLAITRRPGPSLADCALTHMERQPIDPALAVEQHAQYLEALASQGLSVVTLPEDSRFPDGVFVEDTMVAVPELVVLTRPGAPSREAEPGLLWQALEEAAGEAPLPPMVTLESGRLDGGDVLEIERTLFVGLSGRSDRVGAEALGRAVAPRGYTVRPVELGACLHLKTAVTFVGGTHLLVNPAWVDPRVFGDLPVVEVDPAEPFAANSLTVGERVVYAAAHRRTGARLEEAGFDLVRVPTGELAKAEAGVTCCSVIIPQ